MRNGDMVAAAFLWKEADLENKDNLQIFGLILPRLTFLLDIAESPWFQQGSHKSSTRRSSKWSNALVLLLVVSKAGRGIAVHAMQPWRTGRQGRG